MIRPVYIYSSCVANWSETSDVAAEKAFFRDQKKIFFKKFVERSCKEGRGQTMRGSGQYMVQKHQIQRASVYMM
jgi:hypothetical protein